MRLAIWPGSHQSFSDVVEVARHAEQTGWDAVYFADHFMPNAGTRPADWPILECGTVLAALAAAVPRIRIGSLVYGITYRHPAVLANMAATLDQISGGRFVLGVGAGWQVNEHEQYGIELPPVKQRLDRFVEALRVLQGLLREPSTTLAGEYYRLTDAVNYPKPVQDPLPILIGGGGEQRMLKIVARYADVWNTWGGPGIIEHKMSVLDAFCAEVGRDPQSIERTAQALVSLGPIPDGTRMPAIGGSPAQFAETIAGYQAIGLDEFIVPDGLLGTGPDRLTAMDTIRSIVVG